MPEENIRETEYYNILLIPSREMFNQALVVMMSAILNCKMPCHFYILNCSWTSELQEECSQIINNYPGNKVEFIQFKDDDFKGLMAWRGRYEPNAKMVAHLYLPKDVDRVLYLDCDLYVNKDIYAYYTMDFGDNVIIGSTETLILSSYKRMEQKGFEKHGFINTGVLLLNLRLFRELNINIQTYTDAVKTFEGKFFADQGLLSYVFVDRIKLLPSYKYNHVLFQDGTENQRFTYKYIFALDFEERREVTTEPYWDEVYDEEKDATIVHFAGVYVDKPWSSVPEIVSNDINNIQHTVEIPNIARTHLTKEVVEQFYVGWWRIAAHLPKKNFYELLIETERKEKARVQSRLLGTKNVMNFCHLLCVDSTKTQRFWRYVNSLSKKRIVLLKSLDKAGVIMKGAAERYGAQIVFSSGKAALKELTDEEFEECKKADAVISCCIHGTKTHERDGVKCIDIWDILRDDSLTAELPPLISTDAALLDAVTAQLKETREELSAQNTQIAAKLNEYHSGLERAEILEQRISELDSDRDRLYNELDGLSAEAEALRERLSKSDRISSELSAERDKLKGTVKELESSVGALTEKNKTLDADKERAVAECDKLKGTVKELESSVGTLTEKNKALSADKERVVGERDKLKGTVKKLEGDVSALTERNKTIGEQNERLTASVGDLSKKLSSAEGRVKTLEYEQEELGRALTHSAAETEQTREALDAANQEIERLKDKLYQMENSRSWRYTKIFRKKTAEE